jgi:hypothetical protein
MAERKTCRYWLAWRRRPCKGPLRVAADARERLEKLCRYALRPPMAQDRLRLTPEGQVVLRLRHPWSDGTTDLVFDPVELLERLAVLIPRPRINLILYHGVLPVRRRSGHPEHGRGVGPRATWRSLVVGFGNNSDGGEATTADAPRAGARVDLSLRELRTTEAPTAGEHVAHRQASVSESAPDPPCGRERRPPGEDKTLFIGSPWTALRRES